MARFAASIVAKDGGAMVTRHTCVVVEAQGLDEAHGKVMRIALKVYPIEKGCHSHHIVVADVDKLATPETVVPYDHSQVVRS
jgi:hypothetical protein